MVALRHPTGTSATSGASFMHCKVQGIDTRNQVAFVIDQLGQRRPITMTRMFGKGMEAPRVGETWIITPIFGSWMFAVQINPKPDTGWVTSGGTGVDGTTAPVEQYRKIGNIASLTVHVVLANDITVPSDGNLVNTYVWKVPDGFKPGSPSPQALCSGQFGVSVHGAIDNTGQVAITSTSPGITLEEGQTVSLSGTYFL